PAPGTGSSSPTVPSMTPPPPTSPGSVPSPSSTATLSPP
ncbi:MAG: Dienelactone hydrolase family protein, partial [uncultured Thermomicrobiales bacterium]